MEIANCLKIK